jgi:hypothetical protein
MMFVCLASMWLAGFGLVRSMFPAPLRWSLHNVLLFSLGIGAGAGLASCLWFVILLLAGPNLSVLAWATGGVAVAALVIGLAARRQKTLLTWASGPEPPAYLRLLFLVAIALAAAAFLTSVSSNPHGDGAAWSVWNLRARFLFRAGADWRRAFSPDLIWSHVDYPLLLPGLVTLFWTLTGRESTDAPIAIAFLFALGTAGLLTTVLGALRGKLQALVGGMLLLGSAGFLSLAAAQYAEVPLSFYILASVALLCLQDRYPADLRFSALAGLMAGFAAWTRNDGMIFIAAIILARVAIGFRFRDQLPATALARQIASLFLGLLAPLAVVICFKLRVAGSSDVASVTSAQMLQHLADPGRWIMTIEALVIETLELGRFVVSVVLVLGLYWYLVRFRVEDRDRPALASMSLALGLTLAGSLLYDIALVDNLAVQLNTGLESAMLRLWPAAILLFFLAMNPLQLEASEKSVPRSRSEAKAAKKASKLPRRVAETH